MKSVRLFVVPTAIFLSFFGRASVSLADFVLVDRIEASVNGQIILRSEVEAFRRTLRLRTQIDPLFRGTALAEKAGNASDHEIAQYLVDERIIMQKFPVSDADVEQRINSIQAENKIDRNGLKSALLAEGYAFPHYFEMMRAGWSKRTLIGQEIQTKVSISDDDVKNYFTNQLPKGAKAGNSNYHLQMITVSGSNFKSLAAAKEVANRAYAALKSGETWEEVSKRFSDHPSAQSGGDLGDLPEDQVAPSIRKQVKELSPGQISAVLAASGNGGFYILRLAGISAGTDTHYEKVKEQIREQLLNVEYQHQISLWLERQRQAAFIHNYGEASVDHLPTAPKTDAEN